MEKSQHIPHEPPTDVAFHERARLKPITNPLQLLSQFVGKHRKGSVIALTMFLAAGAVAGVILLQTVSVTPAVVDPDVVFAAGDDYSAINTLGFATLTLGSSATSATLGLSGIPGASDLQLVNLLDITNQHATAGYTVSLARSAALDTDIDNFTVTVKNAADTTIVTWYAKDAASATSFTLPALSTYTIDVKFLIADGVATGNLDSFDLEFSLAEV